jgi:hypothetical protein
MPHSRIRWPASIKSSLGLMMVKAVIGEENDRQTIILENDSRWQLIQRIVSAPHFVRSSRLSNFLLYVSKQTLLGRSTGLNEQRIGEIVFARPAGYDPRDDNIVRAHASRLRLRLEAYFQAEGAAEPLQVTIPRGGYVPVFERVKTAVPLSAAAAEPLEFREELAVRAVPAVSAEPIHRKPRNVVIWTLAILMAEATVGLSCYWLFEYFASHRKTPTDKLWSEMFQPDRNTIIVPADVGLVMAEWMTGRPVNLTEYASGRYKSVTDCTSPCDRRLVEEFESRRYTSMADLELAAAVARLPQAATRRTQIRYVRDLQMEDFKQSNLILAGSLEADPWLSIVQKEMNFVLYDNAATGPLRVENLKPGDHEKKEYLYHPNDRQHGDLATIAFLPNLGGTGNLLIVQGFTLAGTEAAAEFVTNGEDFNTLFKAFAGNSLRLPHFEILLETMDVNGMGSRPSVLALRIYP